MIRPAVVGDAAAIAHVHRSSRAEAYADLGPARSITDASWVQRLTGGAVRTFVWAVPEILGFVACEDDKLHALYVLPGAQGGRIGTALLDVAAGHGASELWVYEANAGARRFYERHGWQAVPDSLHTGDDWLLPKAPALRYSRRGRNVSSGSL